MDCRRFVLPHFRIVSTSVSHLVGNNTGSGNVMFDRLVVGMKSRKDNKGREPQKEEQRESFGCYFLKKGAGLDLITHWHVAVSGRILMNLPSVALEVVAY